jgi:imidazoleglycerol-phosphate dehydratase
MRTAEIKRNTSETQIECALNLDGSGKYDIKTDCGFLTHMLELFARHGRCDINLSCKGDVFVDCHHTAEDVGIVLGRAFDIALSERRGICRYGSIMLCMDEALVACAVDISGRSTLVYNLNIENTNIGSAKTEDIKEFFTAFTREAKFTLHFHKMAGENTHHILEAAFKACARALKQAVYTDEMYASEIPSTKGII